jgi:DNA polymerase-3 subunit beta
VKALCPREVLLEACQLTSAALPSGSRENVKPILKNFKASAGDGEWTLIATDMEVGIRFKVQSMQIEEPGEAILPAAKLVQILREARDEQLSLEADPASCVIKGTESTLEFEMPSDDPGQFPDFPTLDEDRYYEVSAGVLREMIRRTAFAAADEKARYSMSGVLWELDKDEVKLVATDGRRLALASGLATGYGGHTTKGQSPIVPSKTMALLERNLQEDAEELVRVCLRPNEVLFRTGRAVIYSRLVEGRFPDYKQVIPKKTTVRVPLQAGPFQAAVRQAAIMAEQETNSHSKRVTFQFAPGKLTLQSQGQTTGRSKVELPLDYDAKPIDINFNAEYLIDVLKVLPPDTKLNLDLIDHANPALFRCGDKYVYLVMPLT